MTRHSRGSILSTAEALDSVRTVYAELEQRPVERDCLRRTECCQFRLTGKTPYLTRAEALLAAKALLQLGINRLPEKKDESCPLLRESTGQCLIYADRPFGCRTHFCAAAGGPYTRKEVQDLVWRLDELDARLGGSGGQKLPGALREALPRARALLSGKPHQSEVRDAPNSRDR